MYIVRILKSELGNEYSLTDDTNSSYVISAADFKRSGIPFFESDKDYPICVPEDTREALVFYAQKLRAVKYLQYYIANYGEKSKKKLFERCCEKGYSVECATAAVGLLCEFGIVDEVSACERRIMTLSDVKLFGRFRIKNELISKGYERESIDTAFENVVCEIDFYENAAKLYRKLVGKTIPSDIKMRRKISDKMLRYGYSYDEIKYASACEYEE